jgi:ATP-dependent protease ClpP protease subunit
MKLLINFYANVSEATIRDLIMWVTQQLASQTPEKTIDELIIQISSSGGSSDHGLLAYNFLKQINLKKTTIGMGNVDSASIMLFCAGDKRVTMPSCRFVLHEARATISGEFNSTKMKEMGRLVERITDDYTDVVVKITGKSKEDVRKEIMTGAVLSSDEAMKMGLVTEIIEEPYLKDTKNLAILLVNNPVIINQNIPNLDKKAEI